MALSKRGYEIVNTSEDADIIIINTCGFIESAKEEAIDTILEQAILNRKVNVKAHCHLLFGTKIWY